MKKWVDYGVDQKTWEVWCKEGNLTTIYSNEADFIAALKLGHHKSSFEPYDDTVGLSISRLFGKSKK